MKKPSYLVIVIIVCIVAFIMIMPHFMPENPLLKDLPYPKKATEEEIKKWIEDKKEYLQDQYNQKVVQVSEDDEQIIFTFETEYMSAKGQIEKIRYLKK